MTPEEPRLIPVGRSWRDLPPSPPTELRSVSVPVPAPVVAPPAKRRVLPWLGASALIVLLGFVFGVLTPSPIGSDGAAEAAGDDEALAGLPDEIVPPLPPELQTPETGADPQQTEPLFRIPVVPDGFEQTGNLAERSPGEVTQVAVLTGNDGDIVIEAVSSDEAFTLPEGDPVSLRGTEGVISDTDEGVQLTWIEEGRILFKITAPDWFLRLDLVALAESLEVL